ncbi:MAG: aldo/keto reductase [Christensenellales bacterium]|jgi:aryl-alcohol dehydrogenase-like predicted oxidoreductase
MERIRFGKTERMVARTGFGCLPIQRVDFDAARAMLRRAYEAGINLFDTARAYSDSEEKLGYALHDVRSEIIIATKTGARTGAELEAQLETSLKNLKTDYIDIYQFHNPSFLPQPGGDDGLYDAALRAKAAGKIRHIGITNHSIELAFQAVESGLYETLQFPFNHLSTKREIELVERCAQADIGFLCMKGMSGGLVTNAKLPFSFIRQYEIALPIWGVQRMEELEEFIEYEKNPPAITDELMREIEADRRALSGAFCRGCGYCLPCPVEIPIQNANRMRELLLRSPAQNWLTHEWRAGMERIEDCTHCGLCETRCPYGLKPYETMPAQLEFYRAFERARVSSV